MLLDALEALWLEAGQQSPKAPPDRSEFLAHLGQAGRERKTDLVLHRPAIVGLTQTQYVGVRERREHASFEEGIRLWRGGSEHQGVRVIVEVCTCDPDAHRGRLVLRYPRENPGPGRCL